MYSFTLFYVTSATGCLPNCSLQIYQYINTNPNTGENGLISRRPLQDVLCSSLTSQPHTSFSSVISSRVIDLGQELMSTTLWFCVTGVCVHVQMASLYHSFTVYCGTARYRE
jgi:hypothetical protein